MKYRLRSEYSLYVNHSSYATFLAQFIEHRPQPDMWHCHRALSQQALCRNLCAAHRGSMQPG